MRRAILAFVSVLVFGASLASAQATRTWVSGVGDDANPCSRTAPCKTFAGAISKTAAGGEINVLDPGGFGGVTITKAITILSEGNIAGVLVSGTNAIIVNAGVNDVVVLSGLDIEGLGTGLNGINFLAGGALHVRNSVIRNFRGLNGNGINFQPSTTAKLMVDNVDVTNCGNGTGGGIQIRPTGSGSANATVRNSRVSRNLFGVKAEATGAGAVKLMIQDTTVSENTNAGLNSSGAAGVTQVAAERIISANNGFGMISTGASAILHVSDSSVFNNGTGISQAAGAQLLSFQDNRLTGNGVQTVGIITAEPAANKF